MLRPARSSVISGFTKSIRSVDRNTAKSNDGPIQYFDEPIRSALYAKVQRTGSEKDGRLSYDIAGTLSGNWYAEDLPVADSGRGGEMYYGVRKMSFARDVFSPDRQVVSVGGLNFTGLYGVPPDATQFSAITPASGLYVYRLLAPGAPQSVPTTQVGWLLVQLIDGERLRVQAVSIEAARTAPTAFTAGAETWVR